MHAVLQREALWGHSLPCRTCFSCIWVEMFLCVSPLQFQAPCDSLNILNWLCGTSFIVIMIVIIVIIRQLVMYPARLLTVWGRLQCDGQSMSSRHANINITSAVSEHKKKQPWTQSTSPDSEEECCYCHTTVNLPSMFLWPVGTTIGLIGWIAL